MNGSAKDAATSSSRRIGDAESEKIRYSVHAIHSLAGVITNGEAVMGAATYLGELRGALRPGDVIEAMLVDQIAVTHARVLKLSSQSVVQQNETWYRTISRRDRVGNSAGEPRQPANRSANLSRNGE